MLSQTIDTQRDQIARKKLGERRCYRLQEAVLGDQIQVGVHRVIHRRQNSALRRDLLPVETGRFGQKNPLFDAAGMGAVAVMIDDTLAPGAAKGGILAPREDRRVLERDDALVVVAIKRPSLKLAAA